MENHMLNWFCQLIYIADKWHSALLKKKLAYVLAVESNPVIVSKILKDFFDLHMVDYLVLKKEDANKHNRLSVLDDEIQSLTINSNHSEQFVSPLLTHSIFVVLKILWQISL